MTLPRRTLGNTGLEVAILGYGSVPIGRAGFPEADASRLVEGLLDLGVDLFDTAAAYDHAEEVLGRCLAGRRDEVVLVTKTGVDTDYADAWSPRDIDRLVARSLERLRVDHVDVLLLHTCTREVLERGEVVSALEAWKQRGATRFIGYSGDGEDLAWAIESARFDVVEASYSILDQANRSLIASAAQHGLGVLLKRPLANAIPGRSSAPADDYAAQYWPRWQALRLQPADVEERPWMEAAVRFAAYATGATCALVGSSSLSHMRAHADALARGPFSPETVAQLETHFDATAAGRWPGRR